MAEAPGGPFVFRASTQPKARLLRIMSLRHHHNLEQGKVIQGMPTLLEAIEQASGEQIASLSLYLPDGTPFVGQLLAALYYTQEYDNLLGALCYSQGKVVYEPTVQGTRG
ncbi:hypothetical protein Hsw_PA0102 (plasmid) [Hymenobacter swuensis DY53]|uniref:Uncharacterized protein n=1 Tax=Hymenobacter swuensis DY53 TaxID=1227739 RepID=W8F0T3_9BACT|nr:hypothetical protein Hsw_PA0102 [Hymenobacter swuensis DY53]